MSNIYYRVQALETIARKTLMRLNRYYMYLEPQAIPIETLIEEKFGLSIEYKYLTQFGEELGKMVFDDGYVTYYDKDKDDYAFLAVKKGTMLIEASLTEPDASYGRLRFTYAHELAHWILHQGIFSSTSTAAALHGCAESEGSIEWQANYLAKVILMPTGQVKRCFYSLRQTGDLDCVLQQMMHVFEVSKQAIRYRVKELGLAQ